MRKETTKEYGNNLAFPLGTDNVYHHGLSKREYIATQLMSWVGAHHSTDVINEQRKIADVIRITDMLLTELNK